MNKKKVIVLTGAGISQESGISTFRDANGLWENHDIQEVASPLGWKKNPELVLKFYNQRRAQLKEVEPNAAHFALKKLEEKYEVYIVTQNVDDLHERAGSSRIIHLHGELKKARSEKDTGLIYEIDGDINPGDKAGDGAQLRPHIVWFGEEVPLISQAYDLIQDADIVLIIGTSMVVYPAAGLIDFAPKNATIYIIDPNKPGVHSRRNLSFITEKATTGVVAVVDKLMNEA
ncbi:MAG: NAD-dependent deacylase [Bacteroidia bacterium]|nr:NAD-dependent deacylase [Bacteroidia bacterium]